jgi:hypothetical protein
VRCCNKENFGIAKTKEGTLYNQRNCDNMQWHSVAQSGGGSCYPCPQQDIDWVFMTFAVSVMLVLAPIIARISAIAQHAGAAQGPVLSVLNFFQSSDLFQTLDLKWPEEFRWFCNEIASLFSFNLSELIRKLNFMIPEYLRLFVPKIPPAECAFHLEYETRWILSMLSPLIIGSIVAVLIPLVALWRPFKDKLATVFWWIATIVFTALFGSMFGNTVQACESSVSRHPSL